MKLMSSKKGFTIVELVIVIAVIAILAAVLIPTFNSVINKANESQALQKASNAWTIYAADEAGKAGFTGFKANTYAIIVDSKYVFEYTTSGVAASTKKVADVTGSYSKITLSTNATSDLPSGTDIYKVKS